MTEEEQSPGDYFPLDELPVQMQLGMYEYLDDWTAKELRKVDRLRRLIVDGNPRIFEKKLSIPSVTLYNDFNNGITQSTILFQYHCDSRPQHSHTVTLSFENMRCVDGKRGFCDKDNRLRYLLIPSSIIDLALEECCRLVTKGSKIALLSLRGDISIEIVLEIRHLIDSSLHLKLEGCEFASTELFMNIVQEPRCLTFFCGNKDLMGDEFFRRAGQGTLEVFCRLDYEIFDYLPLTDEQLSILAGRIDLTEISLHGFEGISAEGVRRAVKILLRSSPKNIKMIMGGHEIGSLEEMPELDGRSSEFVEDYDFYSDDLNGHFIYKYSYGSGKVKVEVEEGGDERYKITMSNH